MTNNTMNMNAIAIVDITVEDLMQVKGIGKKTAEAILDSFTPEELGHIVLNMDYSSLLSVIRKNLVGSVYELLVNKLTYLKSDEFIVDEAKAMADDHKAVVDVTDMNNFTDEAIARFDKAYGKGNWVYGDKTKGIKVDNAKVVEREEENMTYEEMRKQLVANTAKRENERVMKARRSLGKVIKFHGILQFTEEQKFIIRSSDVEAIDKLRDELYHSEKFATLNQLKTIKKLCRQLNKKFVVKNYTIKEASDMIGTLSYMLNQAPISDSQVETLKSMSYVLSYGKQARHILENGNYGEAYEFIKAHSYEHRGYQMIVAKFNKDDVLALSKMHGVKYDANKLLQFVDEELKWDSIQRFHALVEQERALSGLMHSNKTSLAKEKNYTKKYSQATPQEKTEIRYSQLDAIVHKLYAVLGQEVPEEGIDTGYEGMRKLVAFVTEHNNGKTPFQCFNYMDSLDVYEKAYILGVDTDVVEKYVK